MEKLKPCPYCGKEIGCDYENDARSGLCYALHHEGWGFDLMFDAVRTFLRKEAEQDHPTEKGGESDA